MCGILGLVNIENREPIAPELLVSMVNTMSRRGPDDSGVWVQADGQCGLAHRRLSIMDLTAAGRQPMTTGDHRLWVTFNGEIYNYPTLRAKMESNGYSFRSQSDTEVILHLYRMYGTRFFEHLDGDFAIALWDCEKQRLILTRDRAGVKPLYYAYSDGRFIFASEMKAVLKYPGINKSIDPTMFYHYLSFLVTPPPNTMIKGIHKLETGTTLTLYPSECGHYHLEKYWEPLPKVEKSRQFEDLDEELEWLYVSSVKKRLMSDVPVGVLFSGGVDSTLNVCSFSELIAPARVKTFTVGMANAGSFHDDSEMAREMAARLHTEHHETRITDSDLLNTTERIAYLQDEPISDPVSVPLWFVTRLAKEAGVTVLQAGEGADELFCGYDSYRRWIRHYERLWSPLNRIPIAVIAIAARLLSVGRSPKMRKIKDVLMRRVKGQEFFMSSAIAYYESEKDHILSNDFRNEMSEVDSFDIIAPYYERINAACPNASILQKITYIELQFRLPELLLMRADKMSMANSVELRVPFLDRDLMDFALRVPDSYKLRNGISKEPIKRMASKNVDREDVYRPKTGFGVPIREWFAGQLGRALLDRLDDNRSEIADLLDVSTLRGRVRRGPRTVNEAFQLWVIYNILAWELTL